MWTRSCAAGRRPSAPSSTTACIASAARSAASTRWRRPAASTASSCRSSSPRCVRWRLTAGRAAAAAACPERSGGGAGAAFGEDEELMRLAHHDALAPALDEAALLPGAEDAAHRVQGRAGHLGHVLPGDGKGDLHALVELAAGLLHEAQQGMGDALLHLARRHLDD